MAAPDLVSGWSAAARLAAVDPEALAYLLAELEAAAATTTPETEEYPGQRSVIAVGRVRGVLLLARMGSHRTEAA